ncbi:MAG: T9SS type A sorting domain-containing protein [Burkholderiales bacterium]|nr:T9SS type A sorting domain-containing protein [Bacteroidia bacterium]
MKSKHIIFFILFLYCTLLNAQIINIPDANFKNKLINGSTDCIFATSYTYSTGYSNDILVVDTNHNGEIEQSEALAIEFMKISFASISDVTGLEYFTNLKGLTLANNQITAVNLASLTKLEQIAIQQNQLTSLNLTGLINLKRLWCWNNQIFNLNFYGLPNLKIVYCSHNLLSSLDFMDNPLFEDLGCNYNPNLTSIKIKNNHTQLFGSQTALNQCWNNNPNLNYICADAAEIPALQSFLASCNMTQAITIDSACALSVEGFAKNEVSVFPNPSTGVVYLENTNSGFKTVQVFNSIGQLISTQTLGVAASASIDLSNYSKGVYLLNFQGEKGSKSCKVVKD